MDSYVIFLSNRIYQSQNHRASSSSPPDFTNTPAPFNDVMSLCSATEFYNHGTHFTVVFV